MGIFKRKKYDAALPSTPTIRRSEALSREVDLVKHPPQANTVFPPRVRITMDPSGIELRGSDDDRLLLHSTWLNIPKFTMHVKQAMFGFCHKDSDAWVFRCKTQKQAEEMSEALDIFTTQLATDMGRERRKKVLDAAELAKDQRWGGILGEEPVPEGGADGAKRDMRNVVPDIVREAAGDVAVDDENAEQRRRDSVDALSFSIGARFGASKSSDSGLRSSQTVLPALDDTKAVPESDNLLDTTGRDQGSGAPSAADQQRMSNALDDLFVSAKGTPVTSTAGINTVTRADFQMNGGGAAGQAQQAPQVPSAPIAGAAPGGIGLFSAPPVGVVPQQQAVMGQPMMMQMQPGQQVMMTQPQGLFGPPVGQQMMGQPMMAQPMMMQQGQGIVQQQPHQQQQQQQQQQQSLFGAPHGNPPLF